MKKLLTLWLYPVKYKTYKEKNTELWFTTSFTKQRGKGRSVKEAVFPGKSLVLRNVAS